MGVVGSGSIIRRDRKKDGTLQPRHRCRVWDLSATMDDGSHPSARFEGTEREARAALASWVGELGSDKGQSPSDTVSAHMWAWHARRKASGTYARRTISGEVPKLKAVERIIGGKRLSDVTTRDIEDCYAELMRGNTPSGRPYSKKSIDNVHRVISTMFNEAARDGLIPRAPTSGAKRPKVPKNERVAPSKELVDAMVASLDLDDPHQMAIMLCARFGLRRSEAVILDWGDWDGTRLHIHAAAEDDGKPKSTKNVHSRSIPAPEDAKVALDAMKSTGPICKMTPNALYQWWSRHRASFGMGDVQLHGLRHAYATRLAEAGVHPRVMMELGGWETIGVCMEIYTHVNSSSLDDAVKAAFS